MRKYKWVYYDWLTCPTYILGTRSEATIKFKGMKKNQPSMNYHGLKKIRPLYKGESELSYESPPVL